MAQTVPENNKMAYAPLPSLLARMALPTAFSMLVASLYNIVDAVFIARFSSAAWTALSLSFPVQLVVSAVAAGIGVGTGSVVSNHLGAHRSERANRAAGCGVILALLSGVLLTALILLLLPFFFHLFTPDADVSQNGVTYLTICILFAAAQITESVLAKILQATGEMVWPMVSGLAGSLCNIILDPLLIFGLAGLPTLGIAGAALATGISQLLALAISIYAMTRCRHVRLDRHTLRHNGEDRRSILKIAGPVVVQQSIGFVMTAGMNSILIAFGNAAVNTYNAFFKLQNLLIKPVFGLNYSVMPVVGYSYGAGNKQRLTQAVKVGTIMGVCVLLLGMLPFLLAPKWLLSFFHPDSQLYEIAVPAFRVLCLYFPFSAVTIVVSAVFPALGNSTYSMWVSLVRQIFALLPAAWLLSRIHIHDLWWSYLIAEIIAAGMCVLFYWRLYRRKIAVLPDNCPGEAEPAGSGCRESCGA